VATWPLLPTLRVPFDKIGKVTGSTARHGLYYCGSCKRQFTVTVGTIFERSKVPLSKWWLAVHLMASSKKGVSAHQLHRLLGVASPTAWFIEHRIREAMRTGNLAPMAGVAEPLKPTKPSSAARKAPSSVAAMATRMRYSTLVDRENK
jgi:transposase-like protein